jgi:hypothetical protein
MSFALIIPDFYVHQEHSGLAEEAKFTSISQERVGVCDGWLIVPGVVVKKKSKKNGFFRCWSYRYALITFG